MAVAHAARRIAFEPMLRLLHRVSTQERRPIRSLSVVFSDHDTVTGLNKRHLGRSYVTDVIAFDLRESPRDEFVDGEIYVDLDTAAERAPEFETTYTMEVRRYTVHGLLHLMGYDDQTADGKAEMRRLEDLYLGQRADARGLASIT